MSDCKALLAATALVIGVGQVARPMVGWRRGGGCCVP